MNITQLDIKGVYKIIPEVIGDERGGFFRYYCKNEFSGLTKNEFVQMNHSFNKLKGTLRGLHYQANPHGEEKLVRCIKGEIFDVFVDLRKDSESYLKWQSTILSEKNKEILFLPKGIAHGFITMQDDAHVLYQHTQFYNADFERGIRYNDPKLNIKWPIPTTIVSARDMNHKMINKDFNGI